MNIDHQAIAATPVKPEPTWPLSRAAIITICVLCPVWGGLVLYLAWRDSSPAAAQYANRITLRALGFVLAVSVLVGILAGILVRKVPRERGRTEGRSLAK